MAYSTPAMVRRVASPLASGDGTAATVDTYTAADLPDAILTDAIAEADADIDLALSTIYETPVDLAVDGMGPGVIRFWSRDIALYKATLTLRGGQDFAETDPVARRYAVVSAQLAAVTAGRVTLPIPQNTGDDVGAGASAPVNAYDGDLFGPEDYDLRPGNWPTMMPLGAWRGRYIPAEGWFGP